jgi:energy-coupling factor transport system ATP-binding protein
MALAELRGVRYRYPGAPRDALAGVDLELRPGELVLLAGASGSGKSTLLRAIAGLVPHFHGGEFAGRVVTAGLDTRSASAAAVCARAGLVFQDPEAGSVALTVEREVAFPLENAAWPAGTLLERVAAALREAGAGQLANRRLAELSGGELQRVALAAALAPGPPLLLLDEPTSQLDPGAADALALHLRTLCREHGRAVVVGDHRTERLEAVADRVVVLDGGRVVADGRPGEVVLPPSAPPPLAVGRAGGQPLAELRGVAAGYGTHLVVRRAEVVLPAGTVTALSGENGAGKTTLARVLAGLHRPAAGQVLLGGEDVTAQPAERRFPRVGFVAQDPGRYLLHERVDEEVGYALRLAGVGRGDRALRVAAVLDELGLASAAARHPRDLSGGERERVALASILVAEPSVLVLDEPTRGMDVAARAALAARLRLHAEDGGAVLLITHDRGFADAVADRHAELGGGELYAGQAQEVLR